MDREDPKDPIGTGFEIGTGLVLKTPSPLDVLKWTGVAFIICLEALVVVSIVLAILGIY